MKTLFVCGRAARTVFHLQTFQCSCFPVAVLDIARTLRRTYVTLRRSQLSWTVFETHANQCTTLTVKFVLFCARFFPKKPLGKNTLGNIIKTGLEEARASSPAVAKALESIQRLTNHSARATAISRLRENGHDDRSIMELSGHRSKDGVHTYMREKMKNAVARADDLAINPGAAAPAPAPASANRVGKPPRPAPAGSIDGAPPAVVAANHEGEQAAPTSALRGLDAAKPAAPFGRPAIVDGPQGLIPCTGAGDGMVAANANFSGGGSGLLPNMVAGGQFPYMWPGPYCMPAINISIPVTINGRTGQLDKE